MQDSTCLNVVMFAIGTAGDVYPSIALGRALRKRGHDVLLVTNSYFESATLRADLRFLSSGSTEEFIRTIESPELWQFGKGFRILLGEVVKQMRPAYQVASERNQPGRTVMVAPSSAFGARIANEKLGIPLVTLHLQPLALRSLYDQPGFNVRPWARPVLPPLRRVLLRALDRFVMNPLVLPATNAFRAELGMAPVERPFDGWIHSPDMNIGLFPDWFAPRQRDWPAQFRQTGFVMYDESGTAEVPAGVGQFLDEGEPPIVFSLGSGMNFARQFYEVSSQACSLIGRRGILLTRFKEQIPSSLPPNVRHFSFVPHSQLLPRSAALVHHGGVGTIAQACRAGIPQLVCPFNFDQPDNAARLRRLGVGETLRPRQYDSRRVCEALERLTADPAVRARSRGIAEKFRDIDPIEETCGVIESLPLNRANAAAHGR